MVYSDKTTNDLLLRNPETIFLTVLRVGVGFIMLWAFLDKLLGLGFATAPKDAWIKGGSPTAGFLKFGINANGPFAPFFTWLSNYTAILDPIYMATCLFVGLTLISGIAVRPGAIVGIIFMVSCYLALVPSADNPLVDKHFMYTVILLLLILVNAGAYGWTLGRKWQELSIVKKFPILK